MIEIIDTGLIYRGDESAAHFRNTYWPTVVELDNGDLLASMDISNIMNSRDARSYYSITQDQGKNWSDPKIIWDGNGFPYPFHTTCRISRTPDGQVIGFMAIKDRSNSDQPHTNPENGGMINMEHAVVRWNNDSQSWLKPEIFKRPIEWKCYESCHAIFPVTSETWLLPTAFRTNWDGECPWGHKAFAFVTRDCGKSWNEIVDVFDCSSENLICWEQKQTFLSDGRLLAVCWIFNDEKKVNQNNRYTFSTNLGDSYGDIFECPIYGQTCTPIGLPDNHILGVYRRLDKNGLWGHLAKIEGNKWIPISEKLIWGKDVEAVKGVKDDHSIQNQKTLQFGFPTMIQLRDGYIYLVFWCVENGLSNIRWYRLRSEV